MTTEHTFELPAHDERGPEYLSAIWMSALAGTGPPAAMSRITESTSSGHPVSTTRLHLAALGLDDDWFFEAVNYGSRGTFRRPRPTEIKPNWWAVAKRWAQPVIAGLIREHGLVYHVVEFDPKMRCSPGCVGAADERQRWVDAEGRGHTSWECRCSCGGIRHAGLTQAASGTVVISGDIRFLIRTLQEAERAPMEWMFPYSDNQAVQAERSRQATERLTNIYRVEEV